MGITVIGSPDRFARQRAHSFQTSRESVKKIKCLNLHSHHDKTPVIRWHKEKNFQIREDFIHCAYASDFLNTLQMQ